MVGIGANEAGGFALALTLEAMIPGLPRDEARALLGGRPSGLPLFQCRAGQCGGGAETGLIPYARPLRSQREGFLTILEALS